jgi:hypothetical protein
VRRSAVLLLFALAAAGCGSGGSRHAAGCGASPLAPGRPSAGAPAPATLLQGALERAQARGSAHVRLVVDLSTSVAIGETPNGIPPERVRALARNPFCIDVEGDVSGEEYDLEGTLEAAGATHDVGLRAVGGELYLRDGDAWHDLGRKRGFFASETLGGLIPSAACVRQESEGCDAVDFGPAIRRGTLARLVRGRVGDGPGGTWLVTGRADPDRIALLTEGDPESYDDVERHGRVLVSVGKDDRVLRAVDIRYRRQGGGRVHVAVELSDWGKGVHVDRPHVTPLGRDAYRRLFVDFYSVLILYY